MKLIMIIGTLILVSGCTYVDISDIPFCEDINKTGTDCQYPGWTDYNESEVVCKKYDGIDMVEKIILCYDTLESWSFNFSSTKTKSTECCYPSNCPEAENNPEDCDCIYPVACSDKSISFKYDNLTKYNWSFSLDLIKPENEIIPKDYKPITIYETVCECLGGFMVCNASIFGGCSCNEYCYNKSRIIWMKEER